jgi:hypothetical protein
VDFIARQGHRYLPLYAFDPANGMWTHREFIEQHARFSIEAALAASQGCEESALPMQERERLYAQCLNEARALADRLGEPVAAVLQQGEVEFGELQFFSR